MIARTKAERRGGAGLLPARVASLGLFLGGGAAARGGGAPAPQGGGGNRQAGRQPEWLRGERPPGGAGGGGPDFGLSSFASTISASGLSENLDAVLDLFADVIRNPSFPKAEVEQFKAQTLSQLQFQRSTPQFLVQERFNRAIYGEHPAGL